MQYKVDPQYRTTSDTNMVTRMFENLGAEEAIFRNIHPQRALQLHSWQEIRCKPGRFVQLPHGYFEIRSDSGRPLQGNMLYGTDMDRVKKTRPQFVDFTPYPSGIALL